MHPDYKLLIFDWDGTLANSIGRIVEAMHVASDRMAFARCDDLAVKGIIGLGLPEAIRSLYPEIDDNELVVFRQHYADHYIALDAEPSPLFDGVAVRWRLCVPRLSPGCRDRQGSSRAGSSAQIPWLGGLFRYHPCRG